MLRIIESRSSVVAIAMIGLSLSTLLFPAIGFATTYYVSSEGDDDNNGLSPESAFEHIGHASPTPGDTVFVLPGTYHEDKLWIPGGESGNWVVYKAYDGPGTVTIDADSCEGVAGCSYCPSSGEHCDNTGVFHIDNRKYLEINGFNIVNHMHTKGVGFFVANSDTIRILHCVVDSMWGAGVYIWRSDSVEVAYSEITTTLIGSLGGHTTIYVDEHCHDFSFHDNVIHNNPDSFGVPAIVINAGTWCDPSGSGPGKIFRNEVFDIPQSGGIYLNGAEDIDIYDNNVYRCQHGITLSTERGVGPDGQSNRGIRIWDNLLHDNYLAGIKIQDNAETTFVCDMNECDSLCGPLLCGVVCGPADTVYGRGPEEDIIISNNTICFNGTGIGITANLISDIVIRNNICAFNKRLLPGTSELDTTETTQIYVESGLEGFTMVDHNLVWGWNSRGLTGTDSVLADPEFLDAENWDFRVIDCSPARNKGSNEGEPGTTDYWGNLRVFPNGGVIDIGAYEIQSPCVLIVPSAYDRIQDGIDAAQSGEIVQVDERVGGGDYEPFTMGIGVQVIAMQGAHPAVDAADTSACAVAFPDSGDANTILDGLELRGGTSEVVRMPGTGILRNCTVDGSSAGTPKGIDATNATGDIVIEDCAIVMDEGDGIYSTALSGSVVRDTITVNVGRGLMLGGGSGIVQDCVVVVDSIGTGLRLTGGGGDVSNLDITVEEGTGIDVFDAAGSIEGCRVEVAGGNSPNVGIQVDGYTTTAVSDCFVTVPGGTGIIGPSGTITRCTVHDVFFGVGYGSEHVSHTIVTGIHPSGIGFSPVNETYDYCIAPGENGFASGAQGSTSRNESPYYCDEASETFTLRVDSWGNSENNGDGRIGAFPVACMADTLVRSATYTAGGILEMLDGTIVPAGDSLHLGESTTVRMEKSTPTMRLLVYGKLTLAGDSGAPVVFESAEASPAAGDWYGIQVEEDATVLVEHAQIRHATYGMLLFGVDEATVTHSMFEKNQLLDIWADGITSGKSVSVAHDTLLVEGGTGIRLTDDASGIAISETQITGISGTDMGILVTVR